MSAISIKLENACGGRSEPQPQQPSLWADLPTDIGHVILNKLHEVIERVRFGAVCKSWSMIAKEHKLSTLSNKVLPMLFIPTPSDDTTVNCGSIPAKVALKSGLGKYCSELELPLQIGQPPRIVPLSYLGKYYSNFKLPFPIDQKRYIGFSHGWIAVQNQDYTMTLVYPFGKNVLTINIPKIGKYSTFKVTMFIISPDSTQDDYNVAVICDPWFGLATIKSGEKDWVFIPTPNPQFECSFFGNMIWYQGEIYAVSILCMIVKVDFCARPPIVEILCPSHHSSFPTFTSYLVESTSSDLYLVRRGYNDNTRFDIYKVETEKGELINVQTLNKDTFFVGPRNSSIAIKSDGCVPNTVYFMDTVFHIPGNEATTKVCYYNVEDGTRKILFSTSYRSNLRPIWIVPQ